MNSSVRTRRGLLFWLLIGTILFYVEDCVYC
jgi:hypothetical protein